MGLYDRDYVRDEPAGWTFASSWPPACKFLIFTTVIIFVLQIFLTREVSPADRESLSPLARVSQVEDWLELDPAKVKQGQVWRLVTSAFCHSRFSVLHIVFNMLWLYWCGKTLELMYGSNEFLLIYLTGALISGLAYVGIAISTGDPTPAIGASGAVMAILMLYAIHFPRETICFWGIPIEIRWLVAFYVVYDLHPVLLQFSGESWRTGVAHAAHLGGFAFGYIYHSQQLRLEPIWKWCRLPNIDRLWNVQPTMKPLSRQSRPSTHLSVDDRVDQLLRKISEQGQASLTPRERDELEAASRRYRQRS